MERLRQLIHEIHRRSLWQVLGIYLVASWGVLSVVDTAGGALGLPDWFDPVALALLVLGLPIVLATAFVQEGGPSRDTGDTEAADLTARPATGLFTWRNAFAGGVLAFALWGVVAGIWLLLGERPSSSSVSEAEQRPSYAVLPFQNMSGDSDDVYFTNGMHEEILTRLSKIAGLRVVSRTSVLGYENPTRSLRQIAGELGVGHVVEGSVRRDENEVRITVQLIHAETDAHLWAETYDRELSPGAVFGIQSDVAQRIAEALSTELTPEEAIRVATRPTESQEAYDLFLRGNERRGFSESDIRAALLAYQQAVEIDPEFALAWARLAGKHISLFFFSFDNSQRRLALARETLARAEELDPDNLEVLHTLGLYHYQGELNYGQALEVFERVVRADPTSANPVAWIGFVQRRMGLLDDAAESLRKASEMDPLDPTYLYQRGETAILLRRYDEAEQHLRRSVELDPEWLRPYAYLAMLPVQRDGDLDAGRAALAEAVQAGAVGDDPLGPYAWLLIDRLSRDYGAAARRLRNEGWDLIEGQFFYLPAEFILAEYLRYGGNSGEAETAYRLAEAHLLAQLAERPLDHRVHSTLGRVYAGLGDATPAVEHGQRGVDLMPVEEEAYRGAFRLEDLAMIYAALGDGDAAIDVLDRLADHPTYISRQLLRLDPAWDTLRDHSRFAALVQRYR